jgi:aryl-phospho-beta-D-glucosidase BglC (GH1 family)
MENKGNIRSGTETSKPPRTRFTRRSLLKSAAAVVSAAILPSAFGGIAFSEQRTPTKNPRWYGFNLLEYFSTDPDWMKYFPYKNDGMFLENDFRWIRDWGFNWVRLPMDYQDGHFWHEPTAWRRVMRSRLEARILSRRRSRQSHS